ncbi:MULTISPECIES: type VI secretion system protein TssA [Pseudomonas syringae group]|uniref:type VI secretion system protein TssA n=1 Tax=Pseudomonas syringae group TaxID=136849 RepID=UPI00042886E1|nr:type VI secretion system protein TssA [Pseudomonas viridiflava]MBD8804478.1 type VI secretion system protein TssA [Pseudomonas syringae]MEE4099062.1 type VI secretion system protein TssA [Pseudomonas viridiflava]
MSLRTLIARCLGERDALSVAREQAVQWQPWLLPISAEFPVGEDPGYDDDFQRMREEVNKLSGADAEQVAQLAQKLLTHRCKDLRVATYYLWARLHKDGEIGLVDGLSLLAGLVERFADEVLPIRPNSRKMALEWLASGKVLDTLSLHPEVVRANAERTAAALAWLERGLNAWPQDQRPDLGPFYAALAARLALSADVETLTPQHSASQESPAHAGPTPQALIKSGRDLLDNGRALAGYLRDQPQGWLAAHRMMKSLRWDTVHQAPPQEANGNTRLTPPRSDYRAQIKRLYLQQNWAELTEQVERIFAEGVNHFWLDLQWYLYQALSKQPAPQDRWADIVRRDLGMFLERLPGLDVLCWSDGSPFADATTREWIAQHVSSSPTQQESPVASVAVVIGDTDMVSWENDAMAKADNEGTDQALAWLAARPGIHTGRQRWLLRLLMARVAEQCGKSDLAIHLLTELDTIAQRQTLAEWEPELNFEVKARLLKLLRLKAQRHDSDRPALARRTEMLLTALVALDPVRAAVLCG